METLRERRVGLLRFERKSMAPEATRIPSYPTGPACFLKSKKKKQIKEFSVQSIGLKVFDVLAEFLVFLRQNVDGLL